MYTCAAVLYTRRAKWLWCSVQLLQSGCSAAYQALPQVHGRLHASQRMSDASKRMSVAFAAIHCRTMSKWRLSLTMRSVAQPGASHALWQAMHLPSKAKTCLHTAEHTSMSQCAKLSSAALGVAGAARRHP